MSRKPCLVHDWSHDITYWEGTWRIIETHEDVIQCRRCGKTQMVDPESEEVPV